MISSTAFDSTAPTIPIRVGAVTAEEAIRLIPELIELLRNSVGDGASLGFLNPLSRADARNYWLSLLPEIRTGARLLLVVVAPDRIIGSAQLALPSWPNALHRANIEKLFVDSSSQGQGIGTMLMQELQDLAIQHGRTLLLLGARKGERAEDFYRGLGYREIGVIPGYSLGERGEEYDQVQFYMDLKGRPGSRLFRRGEQL
ncbi:MAG TPA: GNAT family N-acetyltransferase [Gemmatimonadaceae bacterium]|nr:GNAT family N-acetyltransferase [Gemmatimonadaceae bacterium]